jgi:hypothetical protein
MHFTRSACLLLTALTLTAATGDIDGAWKASFTGAPSTRPKPFSEVLLHLHAEGNVLTGTAHMGNWPGDAPLTNGRIVGDHISFTAIGRLWSSSGYPKADFEGDLRGNDIKLTLTLSFVDNPRTVWPKMQFEGAKIP